MFIYLCYSELSLIDIHRPLSEAESLYNLNIMVDRTLLTQRISFARLKEIITDNRLDLLGRSEDQYKEYELYSHCVRSEWRSTIDSILAFKFNCEVTTDSEGKKCAERMKLSPGSTVTSCILNDFPYFFEDGIVHFVLWKLTGPSPPHTTDCVDNNSSNGNGSETDASSGRSAPVEITAAEIEEAIAELRLRYHGTCQKGQGQKCTQGVQRVLDIAWFVNPPHLKSIPEVAHAHIMLLLSTDIATEAKTARVYNWAGEESGRRLTVHRLNRQHFGAGANIGAGEEGLAVERVLEDVFTCSCVWFGVAEEEEGVLPASIAEWRRRLIDKRGEILYCTEEGPGPEKDNIRGFLFSYQREPCATEYGTKRHVWVAATDPRFRRLGAMTALFTQLESNILLTEELSGGSNTNSISITITVNTYPQKFPYMYKFLEKHGYELTTVVSETISGTAVPQQVSTTADSGAGVGAPTALNNIMDKYYYAKTLSV